MRRARATLGGGCFWCLEAVFRELNGVSQVHSGYMGGHIPRPTYQQVCSGATGHAEVVEVEFDPEVCSFEELLEVFFSIHDPTTLNRQGNDVGTQYRSVIFYHDSEQAASARGLLVRLEAQSVFPAKIVTALEPAATFYRAEDHHQNYYHAHPDQPYCALVVAPKLDKFRQVFPRMRRATATD
jgi:peptide-methionine (S)-S-oxide reductase